MSVNLESAPIMDGRVLVLGNAGVLVLEIKGLCRWVDAVLGAGVGGFGKWQDHLNHSLTVR